MSVFDADHPQLLVDAIAAPQTTALHLIMDDAIAAPVTTTHHLIVVDGVKRPLPRPLAAPGDHLLTWMTPW